MAQGEQRLHVCLGTQCNNNCVFCMEEDRASREQRYGLISTGTARSILDAAPTRDEVMFTAGEPTLRDDLPELISHASHLRFNSIGLVTNARRLAYRDYFHRLLAAGLNYLVVSIHGHNARLHDGLTRTPGSFDQTAAGMGNVLTARGTGARLRFVTATVFNRRNVPHLPALLRFLAGFGPDERVLNAIQPLGRSNRYFRSLVPRYSDMVAAVAAAAAQAGADCANVRLLDIPPCATSSLPARIVGFVERHSHFEPDAQALAGAAEAGRTFHAPSGADFALVTKESLDRMLRIKGPHCPRCPYSGMCDGIWRRYADAYGFDEFKPAAGRLEGGA